MFQAILVKGIKGKLLQDNMRPVQIIAGEIFDFLQFEVAEC